MEEIPPLANSLVITVAHEGVGGIALDIAHPFFKEGIGVRLQLDTAASLRDALDALLLEQRVRHPYVTLAA